MKINLFANLKSFKKEVILAPTFKMLEAFFELLVPIIMTNIIDIGIKNNDKPYIIKMGLILLALAIVGLGCSVTAQYFSAKAAVGFSTKTRHQLFAHIQSLSFSEVDSLGTSTLITRLTSDINQTQTGVNMGLRLLLRSPFVVFGAMIMAFTINKKLAFIFVVIIPILAIIIFSIILLTKPLYNKVQKKLDRVLKLTRENLTGNRVVRAFAIEDTEKEKFKNASNELLHEETTSSLLSNILNPVTYVIINLGIVAILYYSRIEVNIGSVSQGDVVALYNYMSQILVELIKLANLIITISKALASKKRIEAVLMVKSSQEFSSSINTTKINSIEFKDVSFKYEKSPIESLSNISFTASKNETIGIIGPTGSGKTTLVNLINRFYDVTSGDILLNGNDIKIYSKEYLRNNIGIVLQKSTLFKGTIRDNMTLGDNNITDEEINKAINLACARDIINKKDEGLESFITQNGKNLSGGEKQRLSIARILLRKPDVLVFDDSTSALDYLTDKTLRKNIDKMESKPITFIVSQRTVSVMDCDKIIVLEDGKIVGIGNHHDLINNCIEYKEIYNSQIGKNEVK